MMKNSINKFPLKTSKTKESILVIDDNLDILNLQKILLELEGYVVFIAQSGADAFQVLSEIDEPDLILLDMKMDDMTGLDFLTLLEEKMPMILADVPVVFLSGMEQIPPSKAAGFIRKHAETNKFLQAVHDFIAMGHGAPYAQHKQFNEI